MLLTDFNARMKFYAESYLTPLPFFAFNDEDITSKIKNTKGRLLYLDNWTKFHSGTESYARENFTCDCFILDDATRGDNTNVQSVISSCDADAWEFMVRIHNDTYAQAMIPPGAFKNFDFQSVTIKPSTWMFDKKIGVYVSFTVYTQKSIIYNPAKWTA